MVEVTSLCQHSSGQLVLVNTVKVNPFGQLNNPVRLHKATSYEGRPCPQGKHNFGLVIWFCQLTKGQLLMLSPFVNSRLRHSVNTVVVNWFWSTHLR